jgi:hypothetical protein
MAEQLIHRHAAGTAGLPTLPADGLPTVAGIPSMSSDALRQAKSCLESSGKRLRKGDAEQTDEVLTLLRAATEHLRRALQPGDVRPGAE